MKFLFLLMIFLTGCARTASLHVVNEYLTQKTLASYHVGTPDPLQCNPPLGERMIIYWYLPREEIGDEPISLHLSLRFKNRQLKELCHPIDTRVGYMIYDLYGEEYCETRGILAYDVQLRYGSQVLDEWRHALWSEIITLDIGE